MKIRDAHHGPDSCGAGARSMYVLFCAGVFSKGVIKQAISHN